MTSVAKIEERIEETRRSLLEAVLSGEPLTIVKAPPGSGKTRLTLDAAGILLAANERIAIAAQTKSQADDICRRFVDDFGLPIVRFHSASGLPPSGLPPLVSLIAKTADLPSGPCVVVGTSAKWGLTGIPDGGFDWLLIDEAWQLANADFMLMHKVAPRFVMVGDPGQILPVVTIETARWEVAEMPPHRPAPQLILDTEPDSSCLRLELPATRRLPADSAEIVQTFYDYDFESAVPEGDRGIEFAAAEGATAIDVAIDLLSSGSIAALTVPTPADGPPLEEDLEVAEIAASVVTRVLERAQQMKLHGNESPFGASQIGMIATHRVMNTRMREALPPEIASEVMIDTAERWQGLERPIMVVIHPVSGVTSPTVFDLETQRLCVMASRHQIGVIIITRDHLATTLHELSPSAEQHPGRPDAFGAGREKHEEFWNLLVESGRVVAS